MINKTINEMIQLVNSLDTLFTDDRVRFISKKLQTLLQTKFMEYGQESVIHKRAMENARDAEGYQHTQEAAVKRALGEAIFKNEVQITCFNSPEGNSVRQYRIWVVRE